MRLKLNSFKYGVLSLILLSFATNINKINCNTVEEDIADILINRHEGDLFEQARHKELIKDLRALKIESQAAKEDEDILSFLLSDPNANRQVPNVANKPQTHNVARTDIVKSDPALDALDSLSEEDKLILVSLLSDTQPEKPIPESLEPVVELIKEAEDELINDSTEDGIVVEQGPREPVIIEQAIKDDKESDSILKELGEMGKNNNNLNLPQQEIVNTETSDNNKQANMAQIDSELNKKLMGNDDHDDSHVINDISKPMDQHVPHQPAAIMEPVTHPTIGVTPRFNLKNLDEKAEDKQETEEKKINDPHPYVHIETEKNLENNQTSAIALLNFLAETLNIPKEVYQNVSVQDNQVTFKLHDASPVNEEVIIHKLDEKRSDIRGQLDIGVTSYGIGEQTDPLVKRNLEKKKSKVLFIAIVAICVTISTLVFVLTAIYVVRRRSRMRHNISSDKYEGKSEKYQDKSDEKAQSAQDYQELCRQRMQVKTTTGLQDTPPQSRVTSYNSNDPRQQQCESTRSSTSSW